MRATKANLFKNDCPSQCDKTHCDVCQFRDELEELTHVVTVSIPPDLSYRFGRDL